MAVFEEVVQSIIDMHVDGKNNREIASELDVHYNTVGRLLRNHSGEIAKKNIDISKRLEEVRADKLAQLAKSTDDPTKEFTAIDQAIDRRHKQIFVNYTPDQLKAWITSLSSILRDEVPDRDILERVAVRIKELGLPT